MFIVPITLQRLALISLIKHSDVSMTTSRSTSSRRVLNNLGRLQPSTDDPFTILILHHLASIFLLGSLPDLDLTTAADDTDAKRGEQVVGGVAVHVDATVEHGGGILADAGGDHGFPAWVVFDEVGDVVDDTRDSDKTAAVLGLVDVVIPFHDWELVERNTPVKSGALLVELLLLLLEATFLDLVAPELLQVVCQAKLLPGPDGPLGWVILEPLEGIAVVGGELVVEVVITLA